MLLVPAGVFHTVRYLPGTVLNVIASCVYDRDCYIEDPNDYFTPEGRVIFEDTKPE